LLYIAPQIFIFFFPAEDGIRDRNVTGVQTCALPILHRLAHNFLFPYDTCSLFAGSSHIKKDRTLLRLAIFYKLKIKENVLKRACSNKDSGWNKRYINYNKRLRPFTHLAL